MKEPAPYASVLVRLLKGPLYEDARDDWDLLLRHRFSVEDWFAQIGLEVVVDERDGLAFVRRKRDRGDAEGERAAPASGVPELVARRELPYRLSLLCVLLAEELYRFEASNADESRLVLRRQRIRDIATPYLPKTTNEAKMANDIDAQINKLVEYGFLRPLGADSDEVEVMRLLKHKIGAETLQESLRTLSDHAKAEDTDERA